MRFTLLSLFPQEIRLYFSKGLIGKAIENKKIELEIIDIRNFAQNKHRQVDDYPYAHQTGMLLKVDVLSQALNSIEGLSNAKILYTCPKGKHLSHQKVKEFSDKKDHIVIISGYYEGIDERLFELFNIERISIGDFVLTSGELPAMVILESITRRLPGVLGNEECLDNESIISNTLEAPQYTRPFQFEGKAVPDVLVSGNHAAIKSWELEQSFKQTLFLKPTLLCGKVLSDHEQAIIVNVLKNQAGGVYDK